MLLREIAKYFSKSLLFFLGGTKNPQTVSVTFDAKNRSSM